MDLTLVNGHVEDSRTNSGDKHLVSPSFLFSCIFFTDCTHLWFIHYWLYYESTSGRSCLCGLRINEYCNEVFCTFMHYVYEFDASTQNYFGFGSALISQYQSELLSLVCLFTTLIPFDWSSFHNIILLKMCEGLQIKNNGPLSMVQMVTRYYMLFHLVSVVY